MRHVPVLLEEVIDMVQLKPGMNAIDTTTGDAGHAEHILAATAPDGKLLAMDADPESLLRAKQFLYEFGERVIFVRENFRNLKAMVEREHFGPVHAILMDLGWSSPQFEERGRGFSFQKDEPLDMRYGGHESLSMKHEAKTAADIVNQLDERDLEKMFREYGEERLSKEIAQAIVERRREQAIERTSHLVEIILDTYRKKLKSTKEIPWVGGLHPATKAFQALRIAVNDELGALEAALPQAVELLESRGRLAVITFHSLEDRMVKHFFKSLDGQKIRIVNKKPVACGKEEYELNPRARSAKLRVAEKL